MTLIKRIIAGAVVAAVVLLVWTPIGRTQESGLPQEQASAYDPAGRRDPFKDLFGGKDLKEKRVVTGLGDLDFEEVGVIGIVKSRGVYKAVITLTEGFPLTIREGERFADGYILAIRDGEIVFRKTKERGIPLLKPKDIVRNIISEERSL